MNDGELQVNMTSDSSKPIPSNYENHGRVTGTQAENWRTPSSLKAVKGTSETKREKVNESMLGTSRYYPYQRQSQYRQG